MSVRQDIINLIVNVNGNQAQNNLNNLRKRASDLKTELAGLKKGTQEYINKNNELKQVEAQMATLKAQIGITALTQKELVAELNKLKALKGSVVPFSAEFRQLERDIRAVENRLYEVRNGVQGFSKLMSRITDSVKQFGMIALSYLGAQAIISNIRKLITETGKLSDSLADIRRVSGLTADEVKKLDQNFREMDTRSSVQSLREIAIVAGKLGVEGKDNIVSFTQALDKLVVALGDELGDANQIAETLGKIVTVFDGKITGEGLTKLGNAFVHLANSGASSAGFIADFDQRLSGIAKSANIGLGALSGLGAGLEELGGRVESSSTAIQKIVTSIAGDLTTAAKAAKMPVKEFAKLFATDATEAMLRFAQGLTENAKSFPEMVKNFQDADENGARVIETLSKMGQSADYLRGRIDDGKKSIQEFGDINDAFALKNETFGAELDKTGKRLYNLFTSDGMQTFAKNLVKGFNAILDVLIKLPETIKNNIYLFTWLATIILALNANKLRLIASSVALRAAILLETAASKIEALQTAANIISTAALAAAKEYLAGRITLATAAQRVWNAVVAASPVGAFIAGVTAIIAVVAYFTKNTNELTEAQKNYNATQQNSVDVHKRVAEAVDGTKQKVSAYMSILKSSITTDEQKKKALEQLIALNPDFLRGLNMQNVTHQEGINIINNYIAALNRMAEAQAMANVKAKLLEEKISSENKIQGLVVEKPTVKQVTGWTKFWNGSDGKFFGMGDRNSVDVDDDIKKEQDNIASINRRMAALNTETNNQVKALQTRISNTRAQLAAAKKDSNASKKLAEELRMDEQAVNTLLGLPAEAPKGAPDTSGNVTITGGDDKDAEKKLKKLKKEIADFYKDLERLRRESDRSQMDADAAELQRIKDKYADLYERAKKLSLDVTAVDQAQANEMAATIEKQTNKKYKKANEERYADALQQSQDYYNDWRENEAKAYANGEISRERYEKDLTAINLAEQEARWKIAQGYAAYVDKAKKDEVKEHRKYEHDKTQATLEGNEHTKAYNDREKLAKAKTNVLSQVKGSGGELAAKKALLDAQFALETENMDRTSEMYKEKVAQKNEDVEALEREHVNALIDKYTQYAQYIGGSLESLMTIANNKGERELNNEKKRNEEKKKSYKNQLDNKLISQDQYNAMIEQADAEMDKKDKELKREQAKREKALQIFNAVINTAGAIAKALNSPWPASLVFAALAGVMGGLQVAAIASAPLPELGTGGWIRKGDKHKDKSGGIPALIERDEAVMSAPAMTDPEVLTVTGTTAQITSALNARRGGKAWTTGAKVINMAAWMNDRPQTVNPELPAIMAKGGSTGAPTETDTPSGDPVLVSETQTALLRQLVAAQKENTEEIKNMKTRLHAVVAIKDLQEKEQLYNDAKKVSGLG